MTEHHGAVDVARTVVPLDVGDLDDLMTLERSGFEPGEQWSRASWESELNTPSMIVLGLRRPAGSAATGLLGVIALRCSVQTVDLDRIVVACDARRRGIGRALLNAASAHPLVRDVEEMILEVRTDNRQAIALYRSAGFAEVITRTGYYGPGADAMVMRRPMRQDRQSAGQETAQA